MMEKCLRFKMKLRVLSSIARKLELGLLQWMVKDKSIKILCVCKKPILKENGFSLTFPEDIWMSNTATISKKVRVLGVQKLWTLLSTTGYHGTQCILYHVLSGMQAFKTNARPVDLCYCVNAFICVSSIYWQPLALFISCACGEFLAMRSMILNVNFNSRGDRFRKILQTKWWKL